MIDADTGTVTFKDDKDWLETGLFAVFLTIIPIALFAIWRAVGDLIPIAVALFMTVSFALAVPFMVRRVRDARSRLIIVEPTTGRIHLTERAPFRQNSETIDADEVTHLVISISDNDGAWYTGFITAKGRDIVFAQGSVEKDVAEQAERMLAALGTFRPDLHIARKRT